MYCQCNEFIVQQILTHYAYLSYHALRLPASDPQHCATVQCWCSPQLTVTGSQVVYVDRPGDEGLWWHKSLGWLSMDNWAHWCITRTPSSPLYLRWTNWDKRAFKMDKHLMVFMSPGVLYPVCVGYWWINFHSSGVGRLSLMSLDVHIIEIYVPSRPQRLTQEVLFHWDWTYLIQVYIYSNVIGVHHCFANYAPQFVYFILHKEVKHKK